MFFFTRKAAMRTGAGLLGGVLLFVTVARAGDLSLPAPEAQWGQDGLVEYRPGTLPVILSIPHEGAIRPAGIPERQYRVNAPDQHAMAYGMRVYSLIHEQTGEWPHLVVCHLHRSHVDMNRALQEAAQGIAVSERAWHEYYGFLEKAKAVVAEHHTYGHLFDLHTMPRIGPAEIGHRIPMTQLQLSDDDLNSDQNRERSSLRALAERSERTLAELVRGQTSFGAMMERRGIPAIPSPRQPRPDADDFFIGGHIIRTQGSAQGGAVDATQIEGVRSHLKTEEQREFFSQAVAGAMLEFMRIHYDLHPAASANGD